MTIGLLTHFGVSPAPRMRTTNHFDFVWSHEYTNKNPASQAPWRKDYKTGFFVFFSEFRGAKPPPFPDLRLHQFAKITTSVLTS